MSDDLEVLWQPLKLRGATLPNRIMTTATTVQYGVAGMVNERHLHFYRERARGGVGLMFTEQLTATPLSDTGFPTSISAHDERQVERLAQVREALDPYPTRFFGQLVAGGATAASTGGLDVWGPARGPSDIGMAGGESTLPFSRDEIAQVVADYARSAANVKAAGLHGVEVHGSHGWLIGQFLSPFYNRRTDEYGGPRREPLPAGARDRPRAARRGGRRLSGRSRAHLRRGHGRRRHHARGHARPDRGARGRRRLRLLRPLDRRRPLRLPHDLVDGRARGLSDPGRRPGEAARGRPRSRLRGGPHRRPRAWRRARWPTARPTSSA